MEEGFRGLVFTKMDCVVILQVQMVCFAKQEDAGDGDVFGTNNTLINKLRGCVYALLILIQNTQEHLIITF